MNSRIRIHIIKITRVKMVLFFILFGCTKGISQGNIVSTVKSPDNNIEVNLFLYDGIPFYQVKKTSKILISKSRMGINTSLADFSFGLSFKSTQSEAVDETYTLPSGKKSYYTNKYNELRTVFNKSDEEIQFVFRVYDDGIAYRYVVAGSGDIAVYSETSECAPSEKEEIYVQRYSKDYKNTIEASDWAQESCLKRASLPLLLKSNGNYILLSEASVNGEYAGSTLTTDESAGAFVYSISGNITTNLPMQTPWRTLMIGSLPVLVESIMMENLNTETEIIDKSWIKPGRAAWNYGGEDTSGYLSMTNIRTYIDWAQEMGWEYFTLDRGWQNSVQINLNNVVSYAGSKNVGVFIWVNQNKLPEDKEQLRSVLRNWRNMGVKGLKVDFWEDDTQSMLKKYDLLFSLCAEQKLLLNLQSCTKPSGLRRTFPHILTSEAVLSNVYYTQNPNVVTASHNINSAIIRSALGATDYNPVDFADKNGKIHYATTWAHQLALALVFESGIQHIADAPDNIRYNISKDFLSSLPANWDDTKCLEADLENYITISRQKGEEWYVASLSNEVRTVEIELSFLSVGKTYNAYIYKDGNCPSEILFEYKENLKSTDILTLSIAEKGGFALLLSPSNSYATPNHLKYEAESDKNIIPFGVAVKTDADSLCSDNKYVAFIGKGRPLKFQKIEVVRGGTYALTFYYTAEINRYAYVKVNDRLIGEYTFPGTGKESGSGLGHKTILVELNAGSNNTIEFGNYNELAPNVDRIVISKIGNTETGIESTYKEVFLGRVYADRRNIIIEQNESTEFEIYNIMGQKITDGKFDGGIISISIGNTGVYLVKIKINKLEFSRKIILR